ncbi:MAG: hypothetical protein J6A79_17610 [Clostridia bacterium]|nr:hypothetical protein [Clostridia bacterium]
MALEELLLAVSTACGEKTRADISFAHSRLLIRYGGDRFNPVQHAQNEMETVSNEILSRAWLMPTWRWRGGANELRLYFRTKKVRPELVMLLCIAAAVLVGVLGNMLPENIQDGMADYVLHFHAPSGNPPSGRSAWPAESGNPAAEINRCLQFQRQNQRMIKALLHN